MLVDFIVELETIKDLADKNQLGGYLVATMPVMSKIEQLVIERLVKNGDANENELDICNAIERGFVDGRWVIYHDEKGATVESGKTMSKEERHVLSGQMKALRKALRATPAGQQLEETITRDAEYYNRSMRIGY